jgi:hypothetical protein
MEPSLGLLLEGGDLASHGLDTGGIVLSGDVNLQAPKNKATT